MIMFRGREQSRPELGMRLLEKLAEEVVEYGTVESSPRLDGRNMVMVLAPTRSKSDARAESRRETAGAKGTYTEVKSRRDRAAQAKAEQRKQN